MAISLGGAVAPAATPLAGDAANPNVRKFGVTCLDADTGPTAFNHGLSAPTAAGMICFIIPNVVLATTVISNWFFTWTATQVTIGKANIAGSGGAVPGTTVVGLLVCWNFVSSIL